MQLIPKPGQFVGASKQCLFISAVPKRNWVQSSSNSLVKLLPSSKSVGI